MPQTHDVMLDGAGYMLVPGSYGYEVQGAAVQAVRAGVPSFAQAYGSGDLVPTVIDRDAARWTTVGMQPVPPGIGDEPGRLILTAGEIAPTLGGVALNFDANSQFCVYGGEVYFTVGQYLFRVMRAAGNWNGSIYIGAAAGTITSMAVINNLLFMATTGTSMSNYAGSGAIANSPAVQAGVTWQYAQGIWRSKGNDPTTISGSIDGGATWTQWQLDSAVRAVVPWHGRATGGGVMLIATNFMLWELAGQWSGSPAAFTGTVSPIYTGLGGGNTDDFKWLVMYQGRAYTWYAGTVQRWDGSRMEPVSGAPRGTTQGACVAGGLLCVATLDPATGYISVGCYDGVRWFVLARGNTRTWANLAGTGGIIGDGNLLAFALGTVIVSRWALPVAGYAAIPVASGGVTVGPLDAGRGDAIKTWTQVVIDWSLAAYPSQRPPPANPGGTLFIETSVDDGATWATQGTVTVAAGATGKQETVALGVAGIEAQRLLARVTWTPTSTYAAFQIDGVWAAGWIIADAPHRETWRMMVKVSDKLVRRDGAVDARSGETMLQALRALAQTGRTAAFQDIDADLAPATRTVRVQQLTEQERKGDGTHFLESRVALTLVAVA